MKRNATTNTGTVNVKMDTSPDVHTRTQSVATWTKPEKRNDAPAPPPVWTRYIDSRLKQFCVR